MSISFNITPDWQQTLSKKDGGGDFYTALLNYKLIRTII